MKSPIRNLLPLPILASIGTRIAMGVLLLLAGVVTPAKAVVLTFTNTIATPWATPTNWSPNTNWTTGTWKTNMVNTGLRLNFGNSSAYIPNAFYTANEGVTTIDVSSGAETRAMVIGNGSGNNATLTISGGTLIAKESGTTAPVIVGSPGNQGAINASLTLGGGNLLVTNVGNPSGMSVLFRGGATAKSTVTITNNSILAVDQLNIGDPTENTNVQFVVGASGTVNLGGSGTPGTILLRSLMNGAPSFVMATNNFDNGLLRLSGSEVNGSPLLGTNLVNRIKAGGLTVDCQSYNGRILSSLVNGTGGGADGGMTKLGSGALTLYSSCTYNGNTIVNAGTLALGSSMAFSGSSVRVASGAGLVLNVSNAMLSLPLAAFTNDSLSFNYGSFSGYTNAVLNITNLSLVGTVTINVGGTGFPITNLTLLTYNSKTGGGSFTLGTLPSGAAATLTDNGSALVLNVTTASIQNLTWTDAAGDNAWQVSGQADWNPPGAIYLEYPSGVGDVVTFDDTYGGGTVNVSGMVKPTAINVNITNSFYSFNGTGVISGPTGITQTGSSTLDILNSNSFTGAVTVNGGIMYVDNPYALGLNNAGIAVNGNGGTLELGLSGAVTVNGDTVTINGAGFGGQLGALRGDLLGANVWNGPVIIGSQSARIGTESGGNITIAGNITDNGANYQLFIRSGASGVVTISGANNSYGSTRFLGDSTGTGILKLGANNALSTNLLTMGAGTLDLNGFNQTFSGIADLNGPGSILNNGASSVTLSINGAVTNSTATTILDGSSSISLVKLGSGREAITMPGSYSGSTTVDGGELDVTLPMSSSALTMSAGTVVGITVSNSQWAPTSININSDILNINFGTYSGTPPTALSTAALQVNGNTVINISGVNLPVGQMTLISYGSKLGSGTFSLGTLPVNVQATLADTGSAIVLNVSFSPQTLTWFGGATGTWNTNGTSLDWNSGNAVYHDYTNGLGDSVTFDDTSVVTNVVVSTTIHPLSVVANNSVNMYTIGGAGNISGNTGITKNGPGVLALSSSNTYTGGTFIGLGTLDFTNGALGTSGNVVLFGSTNSVLQWAPGSGEDISSRLRIGGGNSAASSASFATLDVGTNYVVFNSGVNQSDSGGIISNVVAKVGSGKLTFAGGTSTFSSVLRVNNGTVEVTAGGTLSLDGGTGIANGAMTVDNGAQVALTGGALTSADRLAVATMGNSTGTVTVTSGIITSDSGSTQSDRGLRLAGGAGTATTNNLATVNLNGGILKVAEIYPGSGSNNTSLVNFNGGLLQASGNPVGTNFMAGLTHAYIKTGGVSIDTGTNSLTIGQNLENDGVAQPDGGLAKLGSGLLILSGANSYNGATVVSNGTLWVNGSTGTNALVVRSGATLGSTGSIGGPLTVNVGGTLSPGTGLATNEIMTLNGTMSLSGTALFQIGKSGGTPVNDEIVGATSVNYSGNLVVTNANNSPLVAGDVFTLVSASGTKAGNFTSILVQPASMGLGGTFNPATGQLTLTAATAPQLTYVFTGSTLQFSWTGNYKLQSQTNSLTAGLGSNWADYPGGGTSPVSVPVDQTQGAVFFRLVSP